VSTAIITRYFLRRTIIYSVSDVLAFVQPIKKAHAKLSKFCH
jgi:hypothetical protein